MNKKRIVIFIAISLIALFIGGTIYSYKKIYQSDIVQLAIRQHRIMNDLANNGVEADAVILGVERTGFVIAGKTAARTGLKIHLQVNPVSRPSFQVLIERAILSSDVYLYRPGARLKINYNPNDTSQVVIMSNPVSESAKQVQPAERLKQKN